MNILLFAIVDYPEGDASSQRASLIVKGLRVHGNKAFLIIPHGSFIGNAGLIKHHMGYFNKVPYIYANKSTTRSEKILISAFDTVLGLFNSCILIYKRWHKKKVDAIILYSPDSIKYLPIICLSLMLRIPLFVEMCEMMTIGLNGHDLKTKIRKLGFYLSERFLPKLANGYIVISSGLKEYYEKMMSPERLFLLPILIEDLDPTTKKLSDKSHQGKRTFLMYCGTFGQKDGIQYIIRAFKIVAQKYPTVDLVISGSSGSKHTLDALSSLIDKENLKDKIILTGFIPRDQLVNMMHQASILLVCRVKSRFAQFGFPTKLGEYCLTGKPIIATRVGDVEHFFKDRQDIFIAEPEDPDSIASRICFVLENYDFALAVAACGKKTAVKTFEYRTATSDLCKFIYKVVN